MMRIIAIIYLHITAFHIAHSHGDTCIKVGVSERRAVWLCKDDDALFFLLIPMKVLKKKPQRHTEP